MILFYIKGFSSKNYMGEVEYQFICSIHLYYSSFFQSICVLGYCVCPLTVALIVCRIILIASQTTVLFIIRFVVVILAFGWSTFGK